MTSRKWTSWALPLGAVAAVAGLLLIAGNQQDIKPDGTAATAGELRKLSFNMAWLPQGSMAGVFLAMDRGYYAAEGLQVEPVRGFGGIRTVNELDQGMFDIAYGDPLSVVLNRSNGGRTQMVGGLNMAFPGGACFVKERHDIRTPGDLAGKTFGAGQNSPIQALLPIWLEQNGVDAAKVRSLRLDPAVVVTSLVEGKVDAAECWMGNSMALFEKAAKAAGVSIGRLAYGDFGLDLYGSGFAVRADRAEAEPDWVKGFLRATYRGYAEAARDPDRATEILRRYHPLLDAAVTRQQIVETAALLSAAPSPRLEEEKIARTTSLLAAAGKLQAPVRPADVFSNAYLPASGS